jgi:hypothetical protein
VRMADDAQHARALGAWDAALVAYLDAADAVIRRGALPGPPDPIELDLLEVLDVEQGEALHQFLAASRGDSSASLSPATGRHQHRRNG